MEAAGDNNRSTPVPGAQGSGTSERGYSFLRDPEMPIAILFPLGMIFWMGVAIVQAAGQAWRGKLGRCPAYACGAILALPFLLAGALPLALGLVIVALLKGIGRLTSKG